MLNKKTKKVITRSLAVLCSAVLFLSPVFAQQIQVNAEEGEPVEISVEVFNGDFNLPPDDEGNIPGWSAEILKGDVGFERVEKPEGKNWTPIDGEYALLMWDNSGTDQIKIVSDPIPAVPGREYTMKFDALVMERVLWGIYFYDDSDNELGFKVTNVQNVKNEWYEGESELSVTGTAPAGTAYTRLVVYSTPKWRTRNPGTHFDNFRLTYMSTGDYTVSEPVFSGDDGNPVIALAFLSEGDGLNVSVSCDNSTLSDETAVLIVGLYSPDNKLQQVGIDSKIIESHQAKELKVSFALTGDFTDYYVKAMVWDDLNNMKPVYGATKLGYLYQP